MSHTIFFSWQADTPTNDSRNFIEKALGTAIKGLMADVSIDSAIREAGVRIDKDTKGVAGTPPIVDTIFRKIDAAGAFVADLTFVGTRLDGRPTPNPNVLLEYGWALKSRGHASVVCVMNTAYGEPSEASLPFNMKHLRWPITFHLPETADAAKRSDVLVGLATDLRSALRDILRSAEFLGRAPPPSPWSVVLDGPLRPVSGTLPANHATHPSALGLSIEYKLRNVSTSPLYVSVTEFQVVLDGKACGGLSAPIELFFPGSAAKPMTSAPVVLDLTKPNVFGTSVIKFVYGLKVGEPLRVVIFRHHLQVAISVEHNSVHIVAGITEEEDRLYGA
jgi:hypothetical protein